MGLVVQGVRWPVLQYAQAPTGTQNPFSSTMCGHIIANKYIDWKKWIKRFQTNERQNNGRQNFVM
jgi:hypothetical protein